MKYVKRQFAEFKSIFVSENLLKENEQHANIVSASTMINVFWICIITWALVYFDIFKIGLDTMNGVVIRSVLFLVIPAGICYLQKGKGKWIKHLLFICFTIMLASADAMLKYNVTLVMVLPVILAARYYNKKFTIGIAVFTSLLFILSAYMSVNIGQQDLNTYNLIIPSGTTITIDTTLRDALDKIPVDESLRLKNIFIHFFLPKILLFNIVAFACAQISQSGKNMIRKQQEISEQTQRIETELNLANAIQKSILPNIFPPFPEHEEVDIYASMIPAKEVGGDFYDMFLIDDDHVAICMADVSGKGVPASLFMMISKILIKNVSKIDMDVSKAFSRVNNMLCDGNNVDIFVTSWFGILDLRNGKIEYVNAGHNPPLLYSKKNDEYTYIKSKPNFVLAGLDNTKYDKNELKIEPGDKIFLYTDGVVESTNEEKQLYGEDRLIKFLNDNKSLNVKETIVAVKNDIDEFVGNSEQFDDITMLELIYKKRKQQKDTLTEKEFNANVNELSKVNNFIEKDLEKHNCDKKTINQINLAVEEIFVNIAKYAYKNKKGKCLIKTHYNDRNEYTIVFEDNGVKFNPVEKLNPDTSLSAKDRKVGGLGILITKKIMDNVDYKYEDKKNILTITKIL